MRPAEQNERMTRCNFSNRFGIETAQQSDANLPSDAGDDFDTAAETSQFATPVTAAVAGATIIGRVVSGFGDHHPIADLSLWIGQSAEGEPDARTAANGSFTITGLPVGNVN